MEKLNVQFLKEMIVFFSKLQAPKEIKNLFQVKDRLIALLELWFNQKCKSQKFIEISNLRIQLIQEQGKFGILLNVQNKPNCSILVQNQKFYHKLLKLGKIPQTSNFFAQDRRKAILYLINYIPQIFFKKGFFKFNQLEQKQIPLLLQYAYNLHKQGNIQKLKLFAQIKTRKILIDKNALTDLKQLQELRKQNIKIQKQRVQLKGDIQKLSLKLLNSNKQQQNLNRWIQIIQNSCFQKQMINQSLKTQLQVLERKQKKYIQSQQLQQQKVRLIKHCKEVMKMSKQLLNQIDQGSQQIKQLKKQIEINKILKKQIRL